MAFNTLVGLSFAGVCNQEEEEEEEEEEIFHQDRMHCNAIAVAVLSFKLYPLFAS